MLSYNHLSLHFHSTPHTLCTHTLIVTVDVGDLGGMAYLTDPSGNVVVNISESHSQSVKKKTVTGRKVERRKDSVILKCPVVKAEGAAKVMGEKEEPVTNKNSTVED